MRVAVFGLGYIGVTAMCCMARDGHHVTGFDIHETKVAQINSGISPITEPGVEALLQQALDADLVRAHTAIGNHLDDCALAIVCVGTPSAPGGPHDMSFIAEVTRQIAWAVKPERASPLTIAYRSTIRPGTIENLITRIFEAELGADFQHLIELVYYPEFLRESSAIKDYFAPPKIVVGTRDGKPCKLIEVLNRNMTAPTFVVGYGEAELTKFVDNAWHATKVAYANEIGRICVQLGLSAAKVHEIFISDTKLNISAYYMRPGGAFGGSCLPKDVRALQHIAADGGADARLLNALVPSNEAHKQKLFEYAVQGLAKGASVLLVGFAFKADSDDLRESPNVDLALSLLGRGFELSVFDPAVDASKLMGANLDYARRRIPGFARLFVSKSTAEETDYDRIIIANETCQYLSLGSGRDVVNLNALA